jgi:hypothetical protein
VLCLVSFLSANSQKLSEPELQTILVKAAAKTSEYSDIFKNLTVEEIKTFESFDETGKLKNQRKVLSDLIIYEPENNKGNLGEFRNVREVDNKKIKDSDKRTVKIFAELKDTKSFQEELKKLNQESSRFDKDLSVNGLTSSQNLPLSSSLMSSFKFEDIGREIVEGNEVLIVKFQQTSQNPNINFKIGAPDFLAVSNTFFRGTIWLDLKNYRILKLTDELMVDSPKFTEPILALRQEYYYQPGSFEIYLPRKIVSEQYSPQISDQLKLLLKNGKAKINSLLQTRLIMEYKNYNKFDVMVKSN